MSLFTYENGMRVRSRAHPDREGVVEGEVEDQDEFHVKWDSDSTTCWVEARDVMPVGPESFQKLTELNKKIQNNIDEATSLLEQAFKKWRLANSMEMEGTDVPGDDSLYFEGAYALRGNENLDLSKFEDVVKSNGWRTSSLYC